MGGEDGHEQVVKLLLARDDIEADSKSSGCRTPLSYAIDRRHKDIAKLFLSRDDVETDSRDARGRTPLL